MRAIASFATHVHEVDHGWSPVLDYVHRRFGLELRLASGLRPYGAGQRLKRPEEGEVFRRLIDPQARASRRQIAELPGAIDRMSGSALHCDRIPLPADWVEVLYRASEAGGYALTHAVVAARWSVENGCVPESQLAALHADQVARLEALIENRAELATRFELATDIWIEAVAMLYYANEPGRVRAEWIAAVLDAQREDGGWPNHPRSTASHPHPTALALWVLSEHLEPEAAQIAWIPREG